MADEVVALRGFRDKWLIADFGIRVAGYQIKIPNPVGKAFVNLYYRYSPPVADYIGRHESLRTGTRIALTPIVYTIKYPFVWGIVMVIVGLAVMRRSRRGVN